MTLHYETYHYKPICVGLKYHLRLSQVCDTYVVNIDFFRYVSGYHFSSVFLNGKRRLSVLKSQLITTTEAWRLWTEENGRKFQQ